MGHVIDRRIIVTAVRTDKIAMGKYLVRGLPLACKAKRYGPEKMQISERLKGVMSLQGQHTLF